MPNHNLRPGLSDDPKDNLADALNRSDDSMPRTALLATSFVLWTFAGCGLIAPDLKAYSGPDLPDAQVAVLDNWSDCHYCVRSVTADGQVYFQLSRDGLRKGIRLRPGTFTIDYGEGSTSSTDIFGNSLIVTGYKEAVALQAGRTYVVRVDQCAIFCFSTRSKTPYVWIEDSATGQVISGDKSPSN